MCEHFKDPFYVAVIIYAVLEFFIGKKKPIRSASTLELLFNVVKLLLSLRFKVAAIAVPKLQEYPSVLKAQGLQQMEKPMKTFDIIKEELKASGVEIAEEVAEKAIKAIFEKALPRIAAEEENSAVKAVAGVLAMAYPAIKPSLEKMTDFNRDGQ